MEAQNVFVHLTYEGEVDIDSIQVCLLALGVPTFKTNAINECKVASFCLIHLFSAPFPICCWEIFLLKRRVQGDA